jgi:hypothetical protein
VLKNMSLVRATVSIKRISAEPEDEAVFAFSPKHVVGRAAPVCSLSHGCSATVANTAAAAHSEQARHGSLAASGWHSMAWWYC